MGFNIDGFELGLDPGSETYTKGNHSITYWKVDNIDAAFEQFSSKAVSIHQQITNVGGDIRVGSIYDPFGNVIGFIQTE